VIRVTLRYLNTKLVSLERWQKGLLLALIDGFLLGLCFWVGFALRLSDPWPSDYLDSAQWIVIIASVSVIFVLQMSGFYRTATRFISINSGRALGLACLVGLAVCYICAFIFRIQDFPRSVPLIVFPFAFFAIAGSRASALQYFHWALNLGTDRQRVFIYGTDNTSIRLSRFLKNSRTIQPVAFIGDKDSGTSSISGLRVIDLSTIEHHASLGHVGMVLIEKTSLGHIDRRALFGVLADLGISVKIVAIADGVTDHYQLAFEDIDIVDLLGRLPNPPDFDLISQSISKKTVMVTGAGGSIGSELCRLSLHYGAAKVVMLDSSESSLYQIEQELLSAEEVLSGRVLLSPVLMSALDQELIEEVLEKELVDTIYHAAAYKHVPLCEKNRFYAMKNNVLSTFVLASAAIKLKVGRFVLISSDKAVRPTNIMGASKRLAELVVAELSGRESKTKFCAVRFGNVLGSSGSVIPKFKQQIAAGGPVTVTDPRMTRYFMSIPEAASLVIQAGSLVREWSIFILDMGEPMLISELAERLIRLSGHEVACPTHPEGIEVQYSGIREGEKLYEELSIDGRYSKTEHPKIFCVNDTDTSESVGIDQIITVLRTASTDGETELYPLISHPAVAFQHASIE